MWRTLQFRPSGVDPYFLAPGILLRAPKHGHRECNRGGAAGKNQASYERRLQVRTLKVDLYILIRTLQYSITTQHYTLK